MSHCINIMEAALLSQTDGLDKPIGDSERQATVEDDKYFWRSDFIYLKVCAFSVAPEILELL